MHRVCRWHLGDRCMLLPMYVHTYVLLSSTTYLLLQFLFLVFDIIWSDSIITMIFTCQSVTIKMHRTQTDSIFNSTHGVWSFCFLHVTFGHTYFLYKIPQKWLAFFAPTEASCAKMMFHCLMIDPSQCSHSLLINFLKS